LVPHLHYISGDSRSDKPTHTTRPQSLVLQEPLIALYRDVPLQSLFLLTCSLYPPLTTHLSAFNMTKVETIVEIVTPSMVGVPIGLATFI
jgi:hypothetical protein